MRNWRINLVFILIILFGAAIISRLIYLQIVQYEYWTALAQGQKSGLQLLKENRGEVFFNGGQVLATNIKNEEGLFVRKYPQGEMASQVVGFLGGEGIGQYGIEGFYNNTLSPKELPGPLDDISQSIQPKKGDDLFLTLDYNIQYKAEELLNQAHKEFDIKKGLIIVGDPNSGRILALANFPNFDPNKYSEVKNFEIFQNPAVQSLYEPGSLFKPITMAIALDQEKITPKTTYTDPGVIKIGGWPIYNYEQRIYPGRITMTEVLEKSINTGAVFAKRQVKDSVFLDYIRRFGFFEPTGIDLQGEIFSENKELKRGREINFATAAFGQGVEVTPIQMLRAFSAIANGGKLVKPYIVEKIVRGREIIETRPKISQTNIISQKTATLLTEMLISVVEKGSARQAKVPGYNIAGKTGTSQVPFSALGINKKGYSEQTWQSFIGFAPAFGARFVILIKLDNPKTKTSEYSAAPIFGKLADYILNYLEIPPDYE